MSWCAAAGLRPRGRPGGYRCGDIVLVFHVVAVGALVIARLVGARDVGADLLDARELARGAEPLGACLLCGRHTGGAALVRLAGARQVEVLLSTGEQSHGAEHFAAGGSRIDPGIIDLPSEPSFLEGLVATRQASRSWVAAARQTGSRFETCGSSSIAPPLPSSAAAPVAHSALQLAKRTEHSLAPTSSKLAGTTPKKKGRPRAHRLQRRHVAVQLCTA